jgi:hypothetical protein
MNFNFELWSRYQYGVLVFFVHHLAYYRVLHQAHSETDHKSEFWKHTLDAHLLTAITDWCKVFGADSNDVHWKKTIPDKAAQDECRSEMLRVAGFNKAQWAEYWHRVTDFRNNYASHLCTSPAKYPVPDMTPALVIAVGYDNWVRPAMNAFSEEPSLQERYDRVKRTAEPFARQLVSLGPLVLDEYEGRRHGGVVRAV